MKKEIHPGVAVVLVVVVFALVAFLFYRRTATPPAQAMSPQGPGAAALRKGGDMTQYMSPAEKEMMQRSTAGRNGNMGSPAGGAK